MTLLLQASTLPITELVTGLTSAGGTALAMFFWNRRECERADHATARGEKVTDDAIAVLTEVNLYLSQLEGALKDVNGNVNTQHVETRNHVVSAIESLKKND